MSSQFEPGYEIPISHQSAPGKQYEMAGTDPVNDKLPTDNGGYQLYLASGKLEGKKALITGGDSGIVRAIAILYAMEGAESTITYLPQEEEDAKETKALVEAKGGQLHLFSSDLRNHAACKDVFGKAKKAMGYYERRHFGNHMCTSFFFLSKCTLPHMSRGDVIITCASVNPFVGRSDLLDYTTTKGAIVAFTRALSNQQIKKGIRVNCVCPGPIWTPLIPATMNEKAQRNFTSPMGRPGQPSEVATCFVFLASKDSSFMSGQCLHPNGGIIFGS
ncbi:hypothetical protein Golomagni_04352 [Golovinomyces magnicellulatus]|nr:hypothetical protein Golomagni_04352 [Golovinomyces magnicellulatus]